MPHISIKSFPREMSEEMKRELAVRLGDLIAEAFDCNKDVISIAWEPIPKEHWRLQVYEPEIMGKCSMLIKRPCY